MGEDVSVSRFVAAIVPYDEKSHRTRRKRAGSIHSSGKLPIFVSSDEIEKDFL
jgi:hypothetical protein